MIKKLGLQLFTIRDFMNDEAQIDESFAKLAALGYTEAQTAGCKIEKDVFAALAKKHGIEIVGTHIGFDDIKNDPEGVMAYHTLWGTTNIGIGGMPGPARESEENLKTFIKEFNESAALLSKHGFKLTYHNHSFEFKKLGKYTIMEQLEKELDPKNTSFVLDTYWVQHGGGDVRAWMEKLAGRIDILHLKDMGIKDANPPHFITEVLQGNINFDGIIPLAEQIGVKYYCVEQDSCPGDPFDSLKISSDNIKARYM